MSAGHPWIKFYPRDWRGDQALRVVSLAARGLWIECLSIMHEASPYGHLLMNGKPVGDDVLARLVGASVEEVVALKAELLEAGVANQSRSGVLVSRRMVRDESRAKKGRKAVTKRWAKETENKEESDKPNRSPSQSPSTQKPEARSQIEEKDPPAPRKRGDGRHLLPEGWTVPPVDDLPPKARECARQWTRQNYETHGEAFVLYWRSERKMKADWVGTWANRVISLHSQVMRDQRFSAPQPGGGRDLYSSIDRMPERIGGPH